ncbi:unnamed protein product [Rotaria sp. Silwood1]|nr:unnamed protein product [Rotaria sp. Silwood1]
MCHMKYLFNIIFLHFILAKPKINLHYTNWINENDSNDVLKHDCLRIPVSIDKTRISREIISYCMDELPSKFPIENDKFPKFTFAELAKRDITSQQLYLWSAPIDLVELYQFYLNQLPTSNDKSLETQHFYNCTLPRFGPMCQFEIDYKPHLDSTLYDIILRQSRAPQHSEIPVCYAYLQCNRGPYPACLRWQEICDGRLDCTDGRFDEEHCWQLEINQCNDDEFRCANGQCIPKSFYRDDPYTYDCLDTSDEVQFSLKKDVSCPTLVPSFGCEEKVRLYSKLHKIAIVEIPTTLIKGLYSVKDDSISEQCWLAFNCLIGENFGFSFPMLQQCLETFQTACPDMFFFPNTPMFFGEIYLAYRKDELLPYPLAFLKIHYICYNSSRYDEYFTRYPMVLFKNKKCFRYAEITNLFPKFSLPGVYNSLMGGIINELKRYTLLFDYNPALCNRSQMYQCQNSSKCISAYRILDTEANCPYQDDERFTLLDYIGSTDLRKQRYKCEIHNVYISLVHVDDGNCNCRIHGSEWCEDEDLFMLHAVKNISFQYICDSFTNMIPIIIEEKSNTDETECEQWSCNNIYTHCDGVWNCPHGEDEFGCDLSLKLNCSSDHHLCVSPDIIELTCLPVEKGNDGNIDCLGATDEPMLCRQISPTMYLGEFYCLINGHATCISSDLLCDDHILCDRAEDERFCTSRQNSSQIAGTSHSNYLSLHSDVETFLYKAAKRKPKRQTKYFSLSGMPKAANNKANGISNAMTRRMFQLHQNNCHRGFPVYTWLSSKNFSKNETCFCPPNYYGDQCQYENQRVSLTIQFRALSNSWSTLFAIIISLIDDSAERIIHSYEQFTYLSTRDCKAKFNSYLLYSTRPKNNTKNYAIHIDIYEKVTLIYRGSLLYPVTFPFLPVNRLVHIGIIPRSTEYFETCSMPQCIHGKCIRYSNNPQNAVFCQCNQGWSGRYCTTPYTSICSPDSKSIGISIYNRSVCVCPINKFGYRCLLPDTVCQMNNSLTCYNGGQCIPNDEYVISNHTFTCICPKGYIGDQCEIRENKIILSFGKKIALSQSIFIHFLQVINDLKPLRMTTFQMISPVENSITIYWSQPFHLMFIELFKNNYYLIVTQTNFQQSITINKMINPSDRCQYISELFNETFVKMHPIRRIKYYHLPCRRSLSNLSCFYDNERICFCYDFKKERLANCFDFDHNMTFDCLGQSVCENEGKCFQDSPDCPRRSMCTCPDCFYGARCQFSSNGFGLSLDALLGYHIQPNVKILHQPIIVKISLTVTVILLIIGFINGILSLMTFKNHSIREVGCGLYLLGSSITTLLVTVLLGLKFFILLLAQMIIISNQLLLQIQCLSLDFLLRVCLSMDQWLNACVAIERAITIIQATNFCKRKSKKTAKIAIPLLLICIIGTNIYDPFYRRLIDEENEDDRRLWCIASYPSNVQSFNSIIQTLHFLVPFIINLIAAIILITRKSHQQSIVRANWSYIQVLKEQIQQHKQLFIAPVLLVILGTPRLAISFVSRCMKSTNDAWLFLIGYFISFIPPMLTFVIFILPSNFYKQQLLTTFNTFRMTIRRFFSSNL